MAGKLAYMTVNSSWNTLEMSRDDNIAAALLSACLRSAEESDRIYAKPAIQQLLPPPERKIMLRALKSLSVLRDQHRHETQKPHQRKFVIIANNGRVKWQDLPLLLVPYSLSSYLLLVSTESLLLCIRLPYPTSPSSLVTTLKLHSKYIP